MSDVRWAALARADLEAIDDFHRVIDVQIADNLIGSIIGAARFLADLPRAGPVTRPGVRKWRVAGTPYLIFYRIARDHVRVLRVRHGAQDNSRV